MTAAGFELRVGGRVWLDGQGWEVAELDGATVRLLADGRLRTVSVTSLADAFANDPAPSASPSDDLSWAVPAVVLAALSTKQLDALQRRGGRRGTLQGQPLDDGDQIGWHPADSAVAARPALQCLRERLVPVGSQPATQCPFGNLAVGRQAG